MGRHVDNVLSRQLTDPGEQAVVDALEDALTRDGLDEELARQEPIVRSLARPSDSLLARLAQLLEETSDQGRLGFWAGMHQALPDHAPVIAHRADALHDAGHSAQALELMLAAAEREPEQLELFDALAELAERAGGRAEFRYRVVVMRALMARAEAQAADSNADLEDEGDDDDPSTDIREQYSELLEAYGDDKAFKPALSQLGKRIRALEEEGVLPSVLVRRGDWRDRR